jgi:5'-3' exonuclease
MIRLLDVSGIFWPIWRAKEAAGKPIREAADETIQYLRDRAADPDAQHVAACCDSGRTFRHEIALEYRANDPEHKGYKAHRPEKDDAMMAALDRVIENLRRDGVPIFRVAGFEADDIIATLTEKAIADGLDVEIVSDDKDLCQLVRDADPQDDSRPSVWVIRRDGRRLNRAAVIERLGVPPRLVAPYLAMVGDISDAVLGIDGIGAKTAATLLYGWRTEEGKFVASPFKSFAGIVEAAINDQAEVEKNDAILAEAREKKVRPLPKFPKPYFTESVRKALIQDKRYPISIRLARLRNDVPLDFGQATAPRVPPPDVAASEARKALLARANEVAIAEENVTETQEETTVQEITEAEFVETPKAETVAPAPAPVRVETPRPEPKAETPRQDPQPKQTTALARVPDRAFELQLEARNFDEAQWLADTLAASRKLKDGDDANVLLAKFTIGRSLGMKLYQCIRLQLVKGQMTMPTSEVLARVKSSPLCEYIRKVQGDDKSCTWITKRRGEPEQTSTYTIAKARRAMLGGIKAPGQDFEPDSAWAKWTEDMLSARSVMPLMRQEYPEIYNGYSTEELGDDARADRSE